MNLPFFIAKRISRKADGTFAASIHRVAVVSIAVGLVSLLIAFMILGGYQQKITEKIYSFSGELLISKYSLSTSFEETSIMVDDTLLSQLKGTDYVSRWQYFGFKAGLLKTDEEVQGVIFKGVDTTFDTAFFATNMIEGRFPVLGTENYSTEVAISKFMANYLRLKVGDKVLIYFVQNPPRYRNLTIVGIYETGLEDFDQKIIMGDLNLLRRINEWRPSEVGGVEVFLNPGNDVYASQDDLFQRIDADLYVESVKDKYPNIFEWLALLDRNVVILLTLILVVACFSMISILLILIMERAQMVGMLKAMGADDGLMRRVFVYTGINLVLRGLGWGNLIGLALGFIQYRYHLIPLDAANYYMNYVPINFDLNMIIGINVLMIAMISASLLVPVTILSRIQPVRAIRFD